MTDGAFTVIVPTYNRARTLPRALDTLIVQTDLDWTCHVLDDGSTDGTPDVVAPYLERDPRIHYQRFDENRGGVAMNEVGMALALALDSFWVRLGSDDWFEPEKLELDRIALRYAGVCFGPYRNNPPSVPGEGNHPQRARTTLLTGAFAASWADIAVRSDVLRAVLERHGAFCNSRLRNMEDWLFNCRAARFSEVIWRGASTDGTRVAIGATDPAQVPFEVQPDAHYTVSEDGATYRPEWQHYVREDMAMTERLGAQERATWPPDEVPPPPLVVLDRLVEEVHR